jgi:lysophospholipase L1-like esterase
MKKIVLLGDSIRQIGYGTKIGEYLGEDFEIWQPDDNCRYSVYTLRMLRDFQKEIKGADIVHWNNGLWDVLRLFGDEPFTDIESYRNLLKRVHKRIVFLFPNAKIIFALSTSVLEELGDPDFFRYNSEIEQYNEIATEVMNELGVEINDLYKITKNFDSSLRSDWVHYNDEGSEILADKVIEVCLND